MSAPSLFPETEWFAMTLMGVCVAALVAMWWAGGLLARYVLLDAGPHSVRRWLMRRTGSTSAAPYLWLPALAARLAPVLITLRVVQALLERQRVTAEVVTLLREQANRWKHATPVVIAFDILVIVVGTAVLFKLLALSDQWFSRRKRLLLTVRERVPARWLRMISAATARRLAGAISTGMWAARYGLALLLLLTYLAGVFSLFPATRDLVDQALEAVQSALMGAWDAVIGYLPNLANLLAIGLITFGVLRVLRLAATEVRRGAVRIPGFYPEWAHPTYQLAKVLTLALALVMAFPFLPGADSPIFHGMSVFFGVLISLGSTSFIANIVAGVVLTYTRGFRVGDRVRIADTQGDVVEKGLLVTRVRTIKNVDVTIPNSLVMNSHMINYSSVSRDRHLILNTTVTLSYDLPWRMVHETLVKAALATPGILATPRPFVFQTALNDYHVSYQLNASTDDPNDMDTIYSELHGRIQDACNAAGFEILSPGYTSVRDGNATTIPAESRPKGHVNPVFKIDLGRSNPPTGR